MKKLYFLIPFAIIWTAFYGGYRFQWNPETQWFAIPYLATAILLFVISAATAIVQNIND